MFELIFRLPSEEETLSVSFLVVIETLISLSIHKSLVWSLGFLLTRVCRGYTEIVTDPYGTHSVTTIIALRLGSFVLFLKKKKGK